jgi:hypothetical protein
MAMFRSDPSDPHPVCTIRLHPEGGYTAVHQLSDRAAPDVSPHAISLPTPADVERYARNHYGAVFIRLDDGCRAAAAGQH